MYFFQPALLTLCGLMAADGTLFSFTRKRQLCFVALFLLTLCASAMGEGVWENFTVFPAALVLMLGTMAMASGRWERILLSGLFGGIAAWKLADMFPLFFELALLGGLALSLFTLLYCKSLEERFCACALGGIVYELCFCLQEYFLFTYCRIRLGSSGGLSISTMSMCAVTAAYLLHAILLANKPEKQALFKTL